MCPALGGPPPRYSEETKASGSEAAEPAPVLPCDPSLCSEGCQDHVLIHEGYVSVTLTFHHQRQLRTRDPGSGTLRVPYVTFSVAGNDS